MTLSPFFPHSHDHPKSIGYCQVNLDPAGPYLGHSDLSLVKDHQCFSEIELYLTKVMINSTTIIGAGNSYMQGLVIAPLPQCIHYKILVIGVPNKKYQEVKTHDDFTILMIIVPVSLLFPSIKYLDLEMELTALIQQNYGKTPEYLEEIIVDYLKWKL